MCKNQNNETSEPEIQKPKPTMEQELSGIAKILVQMETSFSHRLGLLSTSIIETHKVSSVERDQIAYGLNDKFQFQSNTNFQRFMCLEATLTAMWVQINKICEHIGVEQVFEGYEAEFNIESYLDQWMKELVEMSNPDTVTGIQVIEQLQHFLKKQAEKKE